ncbi:MAG: hypothetical protein EOP90_14795 [Lysobacteraceae bacterium]|nr:MAG: hypothetical protein EOP90_14795 [Xanthomonadaceae bacterium]
MKTISPRATWVIRIACYALFLAFGWFAAAAVSDFYLRDKASALCRAIVEGDPVGLVESAAREVDATLPQPAWSQSGGGNAALVIPFPGLPPFDGYACRLVARDGTVRKREFLELADLPSRALP